ncbi:PhoX family phosphatase [Solimonas sp. K1W22B-7]|uniref:PhoX family protein n=1 Tax=Solimonas sp. K1W22B-7 TaxID=2303331 RepID=UPI000E3330D0|nr:PhoX family phosphatase [Solimonas sp. K1W22B-7]AXQ29376.1 PhoX family phosphatase [Solimonas sp. K1W22B-7]
MSHHDHDDDVVTNTSNNPHILEVAEARFTRRQTLFGGLSATTVALFGGLSLAGCDNDDDPSTPPPAEPLPTPKLSFVPVAKSTADVLTVPDGYTANVLYSLGDAIKEGIPAWSDTGTETGSSYADRAGDHHDGMYFFGLAATGATPDHKASDRGMLCMNHEALTTTYLHAAGSTTVGGVRTIEDECIKEMNAHGVSVIEVKKTAGSFAVVKGALNRRITTFTDMELSGPVRGDAQVKTKYSTTGTKTRGTVNNCANGYTPWGTYLTCEENWAGYFARAADDNSKRTGDHAKEVAALNRYGNAQGAVGRHRWETVTGDNFARWNTSVLGTTTDGTDDYRNVINTFGFVVEIDPYDPTKTPKKRTALGRFAHEGCWPGPVAAGKPIVFYMGDDNRGDYVYKFVSEALWNPADANKADRMAVGDKYMDRGKLYVAKFNANGTGDWVELTFNLNGLTAANAAYPFANQADVCLNSRLAGDAVGATKMDRPEWGAVNPANGEVYLTLTNNSNRGSASQPVDAANPRNYDADTGSTTTSLNGNVNGHVIRWHEDGDSPAATTFEWDIFLFGARAAYPAEVNQSGLNANNDLSSPDGLWFDPRGVLWIQTDDGAYTDTTNCMMLAAVPGEVGDGGPVTVAGQATYKGKNLGSNNLRRFLVGPKDCEITGIHMTPDGKTMFVNIQHPGETGSLAAPLSHWPGGGTARPRSSTVVVTRDDGGVIAI